MIDELAIRLAQEQINEALASITGNEAARTITLRRPRRKKSMTAKAKTKPAPRAKAPKRKPARAAARKTRSSKATKAVVAMAQKLKAKASKPATERPTAPARTRGKPQAERFAANVVDMAKAKAEIVAEAKAEAKREAQASKPAKASDRTEARLAKMPPEKADALRKIALQRNVSLATVVDHPSRYLKAQVKPLGTVAAE